MWGGVKKRTHYGDVFKKWSATRGVEELRTALFKEPRPWYIAYSLHQHNNLLQDRHCARLLAWSTSVVELRPTLAAKREAYRYTHEMFQLLMHHHKVGRETLNEFMRLCAVGADLSSAFDWFRYWQEAQLDDCAALHTLTWLLQVALTTPSDERAEDMALTVLELFQARFPADAEATARQRRDMTDASSNEVTGLPQTQTTPADTEQESRRRFLCVFKALEPRLQHNATLRAFLETIAYSSEVAAKTCAAIGWPVDSPHRIFPQLEQHIGTATSGDIGELDLLNTADGGPALRDSLLHPDFVAKLQSSAARSDVAEVVALVEHYEQRVKDERDKSRGDRTPALRRRPGEDELWHHSSDPSAVAYRHRLIQEGGVTPELYHYLLTALATTQPSAALRTLDGMAEAHLRPLDLSRAAVLVAVKDSVADQRRLFAQQLSEIDARARLDADSDTFKIVEAYWKFDYVEFFHYRNALSKAQFYLYLMARLGAQPVQQLLLDTQAHGPLATAEDLVLLDDDLRQACRSYFRSRVGHGPVQDALDTISTAFPKLDISLVGTLPHFENYFVEETDAIANSEAALQQLMQPYDTIYVLDTSFIETSESFVSVGAAAAASDVAAAPSSSKSLVLVPFATVAQLASSVMDTNTFVSFDPAMQQAIQSEPFLASQRLRALFAMLASSASTPGPRRTRLLHFTECLCAHQVEPHVLNALGLSPATKDNDQLLVVLAMLSSLKPQQARLVLCTDDAQLVEQLEALQTSPLFGSAVEVVSTSPPQNLDVSSNLLDDNPQLPEVGWAGLGDFTPRLNIAEDALLREGEAEQKESYALGDAAQTEHRGVSSPELTVAQTVTRREGAPNAQLEENTGAEKESSDPLESPWLALLNDDNDDVSTASGTQPAPTTTSTTTTTSTLEGSLGSSAESPSTSITTPISTTSFPASIADEELRDRLMDLYETPYDVVPVGVRMETASAIGNVFDEFDSMDPEERAAREADRAAAASRLSSNDAENASGGGGAPAKGQPRRRRSPLEREMLSNRGVSNKDRFRLARRLSNQSGARVPFNMRYRVVEANVRDPRNAHLRKAYQDGLEKKRAAFKRRHG